jgi:hypothetical protein
MPLVPVEPAERGAAPAESTPLATGTKSRWRVFPALLLIAAGSACSGNNVTDRPAAASFEPRSFALYALSRGKGVPEPARAALADAKKALEDLQARGADISITQERIGLEGETRLCATFADAGLAEEALEKIRRLASGADLVNLTEEPCGATARP